jgi:hypothetical protein
LGARSQPPQPSRRGSARIDLAEALRVPAAVPDGKVERQ